MEYLKYDWVSMESPVVLHVWQNLDTPGPVVVLLPGLGANGLIFEPSAAAIGSAFDASVTVSITYALPFGPSLRDVGDSVAHALTASWPATTNFILVGFSMGGFVAQEIRALVPDAIAGVVLLASACGSKDLPVPATTLFKFVAGATRDTQPSAEARLLALFPKPWLATATDATISTIQQVLATARISKAAATQELHATIRWLVTDWHSLPPHDGTTPTLVLHGDLDTILTNDCPSSSNVTTIRFPDAGHGLMFQALPDVSSACKTWAGTSLRAASGIPTMAVQRDLAYVFTR